MMQNLVGYPTDTIPIRPIVSSIGDFSKSQLLTGLVSYCNPSSCHCLVSRLAAKTPSIIMPNWLSRHTPSWWSLTFVNSSLALILVIALKPSNMCLLNTWIFYVKCSCLLSESWNIFTTLLLPIRWFHVETETWNQHRAWLCKPSCCHYSLEVWTTKRCAVMHTHLARLMAKIPRRRSVCLDWQCAAARWMVSAHKSTSNWQSYVQVWVQNWVLTTICRVYGHAVL